MFSIKVNGKTVLEIYDKRVTRVGLQTSGGEAGAAYIAPDQNEVNLLVDVADIRDRNLIDVEAQVRPRNVRDDAEAFFPPVVENIGLHAPLETEKTTVNKGLLPPSVNPPEAFEVSGEEAEDEDDEGGEQLSLPEPPAAPES